MHCIVPYLVREWSHVLVAKSGESGLAQLVPELEDEEDSDHHARGQEPDEGPVGEHVRYSRVFGLLAGAQKSGG